MTVPASSFRNLCRSSPWKWQSLRIDLQWRAASGQQPLAAVRCWIRRPKALRVEAPDGSLLFSSTGINDSRDTLYISGSRKPWLLPAHLVTPVYDDAGLVRRRPEADYTAPHFGDPRLAAVLDPVELAGNAPVSLEFPLANLVEVGDVSVVEHEGRQAWQAIVSPNASYRPLATESPLLGPGRTLLRVDVETAVVLSSEFLDGSAAGSGHRLSILGVDEYLLDDLFTARDFGLTDVREHRPWFLPEA